MNNSSQKNLIPSTKSKPVKLLWNIGPHIVCIIDKNIVEKLKIDEGDICELSPDRKTHKLTHEEVDQLISASVPS